MKIGSIVIRCDELERMLAFWQAALDAAALAAEGRDYYFRFQILV